MSLDAERPNFDNRPVGLYDQHGLAPQLDLTIGPVLICPLHCKQFAEAAAAKHGAVVHAQVTPPTDLADPRLGRAICSHGETIYLVPDEDWLFQLRHGGGL